MKDILNNDKKYFEIKEEYLTDINKKLDANRRRMFGFFHYLGIFIIISVALFTIFKLNLASEKNNHITSVIKAPPSQPNNKSISINESKTVRENNAEQEFKKSDLIDNSSIKNSVKNENQKTPLNDSKKVIRKALDKKKSNNYKTAFRNNSRANDLILSSSSSTSKQKNDWVHEKKKIKKSNNNITINSRIKDSITTNKQYLKNDTSIAENKQAQSTNNEISDINNYDSTINSIKKNDSSLSSDSTEFTLIDKKNKDCENKKETNFNDSNKIIIDTIRTIDTIKKKWILSLAVGGNYSFSNLTNFSKTEYGNKREDEENYLASFTNSLLVSYKYSDNIQFTSGINYTKYGSNNNYSSVTFYDTTVVSSITISQDSLRDTGGNPILDSIGNPTLINVSDTNYRDSLSPYYNNTAKKNSGKVTFSYIEIPITIGFYKKYKKLDWGINTGLSFGLLTWQEGLYINDDLRSMEIATSKKLIVNYLFNPEINYYINKQLSIGFYPNFRLGLNNLSLSEPLNRKYISFQLNLKMNYHF